MHYQHTRWPLPVYSDAVWYRVRPRKISESYGWSFPRYSVGLVLSGRNSDYRAYGGRTLDSRQVSTVQTSEGRRSVTTRKMRIWSTGDPIFGFCYLKRWPKNCPGEGESSQGRTGTSWLHILMGLPWPDQLLWKVHFEILAGGSPL
jgi:hypothetical protein